MIPNLFVHHKHGGSFDQADRDSLRARNLRKVVARYPDYPRLVESFVQRDPARSLREIMTMLISCGEAAMPPIMVIDHELGGGATSYRMRMVEERLRADQPVLLLTAGHATARSKVTVSLCCRYRGYSASFDVKNLHTIEALFADHLPLQEIFYNNAVSFENPVDLADTVHRIKSATGARLTVAMHDYYPLCPSFNLLNAEGAYCRLPDIETCRVCLPKNRFAANPEHEEIDGWRTSWGALLQSADRILCFSEDSRRHVMKLYPACSQKIEVRPHTLDVRFPRKPRLNQEGSLHIGIVGAIGYAKGAQVVADLARHLLKTDPQARVTVIGILEDAPTLSNLKITGPYRPEQLPDLLERHQINVCFVPSICPETFSYVTAELMALGVPVACFDLGAPADRVRKYEFGMIIEPVTPSAAAEALASLRPRAISAEAVSNV